MKRAKSVLWFWCFLKKKKKYGLGKKGIQSANVQELPISAFMWFKAIYWSARTFLWFSFDLHHSKLITEIRARKAVIYHWRKLLQWCCDQARLKCLNTSSPFGRGFCSLTDPMDCNKPSFFQHFPYWNCCCPHESVFNLKMVYIYPTVGM